MPELRKDPVVGRWVVIAPERARRPDAYLRAAPTENGTFCPFCESNESATPNEIVAYREHGSRPNGPGWRTRVIPNKFPAVQIEGQLANRGDGIYDLMNGIGAHEIIIESPRHEENIANLSVPAVREALWAYHDRLVDLKQDRRLLYGMVFKNKGRAAGASIEHTHSQLIATPFVPPAVAEELAGASRFFENRGRCIYCDMVRQELADGRRIVAETPQFVAFCPFASRFPFETWILPRRHMTHFEAVHREQVDELGMVLKLILTKLSVALEDPAYNYVLHTAPFNVDPAPHYHWHIEILPRLTQAAGFEWGSGCFINIVVPEEAAAFLRDVEEAGANRPKASAVRA